MKATVTIKVRIEGDDGNSSEHTATTSLDIGGNPRFTARGAELAMEVARDRVSLQLAGQYGEPPS